MVLGFRVLGINLAGRFEGLWSLGRHDSGFGILGLGMLMTSRLAVFVRWVKSLKGFRIRHLGFWVSDMGVSENRGP